MGKPEKSENFEEIQVDDISIFVEKNVLEEYAEADKLLITVEGYGRYLLEFVI